MNRYLSGHVIHVQRRPVVDYLPAMTAVCSYLRVATTVIHRIGEKRSKWREHN